MACHDSPELVDFYLLASSGPTLTADQAWIICVPTEKFDEVCAMFSREPLSQTFEPAEQILPLVCSLLHAYPHLKMKGVRFSLFVAPSSEYFVSGFGPDKFERSRFQVPYPKLEYFVQGMMDTQNWVGVQELVDGMDLTEEWGEGWLDLDKPGEVEYAKSKNERILGSMSKFPEAIPTSLSEGPIDLRARWQRIVRGKERRIDILAPKGKYITKYRKTGSQDPRLKESRVC